MTALSIPERAHRIATKWLNENDVGYIPLGSLMKLATEAMHSERELMARQVSAMLQWGADERTCEEMLKFLRDGGK